LAQVLKVLVDNIVISQTWQYRWKNLFGLSAFKFPLLSPERYIIPWTQTVRSLDQGICKCLMDGLVAVCTNYIPSKSIILVAILNGLKLVASKEAPPRAVFLQLFWVCISTLHIGNVVIFRSAVQILHILLAYIEDIKTDIKITAILNYYQSEIVKNSFQKLNKHCGATDDEYLGLYLCASLIKGLTDSSTRKSTKLVLLILLKLLAIQEDSPMQINDIIGFLCLLVPSEGFVNVFRVAQLPVSLNPRISRSTAHDQQLDTFIQLFMPLTKTHKFICTSFMWVLLESSKSENELLLLVRIFSRIAEKCPDTLSQL
jgi:hypothetical protein